MKVYFQLIWLNILGVLDQYRVNNERLPKTVKGAAAMGRRYGILLKQGNPFLANENLSELHYRTPIILNQPVHIFLRGLWPLTPNAEAFQHAKNKAIWDFHMAPYRRLSWAFGNTTIEDDLSK